MNAPDASNSAAPSNEDFVFDFETIRRAALAEAAAKAEAEAAATSSVENCRDGLNNRDLLQPNAFDDLGQQGLAGPDRDHTPSKSESEHAPNRKPYFKLIEIGKNPGVYWYGVENDGSSHKQPVWVCSPLQIVANTRDGQGSEWGRLLVWADRDGREHRWAMPMGLLASDGADLRRYLLSEGMTITNNANVASLARAGTEMHSCCRVKHSVTRQLSRYCFKRHT
jgi:hypothetical protein